MARLTEKENAMPSIWIEASMVNTSDCLVVNNVATLEVVNITNFVGYVWITNADGDTFVYPSTEIVNVICEYDSPDYDDYDYAYYDAEYDRQERAWMEDEARYSEERDFFFIVSHIDPAMLDGWFSG